MTAPAGFPAQPAPDPVDEMAKLATHNDQLVTRPGLLQALLNNNATAQQAGVLNQFLSGLQAQRAVVAARTSNAPLNLTTQEQQALQAMGTNYADVQQTGASPTPSQKILKDAHPDDGWFSSPSSFFHHLTHNAVTNAVGDTVQEGWQDVDSYVSNVVSGWLGNVEGAAPTSNPLAARAGAIANAEEAKRRGNVLNPLSVNEQNAEAMRALGYDPGNPFSVLAYRGKGYVHDDTSDLAGSWDQQHPGMFGWDGKRAVVEAQKFMADPNGYIRDVEADSTLTVQQKAQLVESQAFGDLVQRVAGRQSSIGNNTARGVGLDPVKDPKAFAYTSAVADTAASFFLDPTTALFAGAKAYKVSKLALDGLGDSNSIRKIMDTASKNVYHQGVQRGFQTLIDDAKVIRESDAATVEGQQAIAAAYAHSRAAVPGIVELMPDVVGGNQYLDSTLTNIGRGEPITNLAEMTDYLASKNGLMRLTAARPALEAGVMPGYVSKFSYKWLKAGAASKAASRTLTVNLSKDADVEKVVGDLTNQVDVQTGRPFGAEPSGQSLDDIAGEFDRGDGPDLDGELRKLTGGESTLPSRARAVDELGLNAAERGDLIRMSRQGMSMDAIAARMKLGGRRLKVWDSLLPRNNRIITGDADGAEKVYRFGLSFLSKGDAAMYGGLFARGDEGVQKAVIDGIIEQTAHAAGLASTETGRAVIERLRTDLDKQSYSHVASDITDPVTGMTRDAAVHLKQVRTEFTLPAFDDLYKQAAKSGLYQHTAGRVFSNTYADAFLNVVKMGWLLKPSVKWRNVIEGQGNVAIRGKYLDLLRAKTAAGDALTPRGKYFNRAVHAVQLDKLGMLYKRALAKTTNPEWEAGLRDFTEGDFAEEFQPTIHAFGSRIIHDAAGPDGLESSSAALRAGLKVKRLRRTGYGLSDVSGVTGTYRYHHALNMAVEDSVELNRATIEAVRNPEAGLDGVVAALKRPENMRTVEKMIRYHQYTDANGVTRLVTSDAEREQALLDIARAKVSDVGYLLTGQDGDFLDDVADHILTHNAAPDPKWIHDNLQDAARPKAVLGPEYAPAVDVDNLPLLPSLAQSLLDPAGKLYKIIVEDGIKRTTTEPAFLMNYADARYAMRGVEKNVAESLAQPHLDSLVAKHELDLVELRAAGHTDAKEAALVEAHDTAYAAAEEAAAKAAKRIVHDAAVKRAYEATEAMVDDPGLRTQMDVVGRNFFMFSRATAAFQRRWVNAVVMHPQNFRRAQLALEGAHHSGFVYTDQNGNVNFTYPGSDFFMQQALRFSQLVPGLGPAVLYPVSGALHGQVNMIAPGLENPAKFSLSPMSNMPIKVMETLFPNHREILDEVDSALNGEQSVGHSWFDQLEPTAIKKFTDASGTGRTSAFASAMNGAIANLAATDPDGSKGIFPGPGATAAERQAFLDRLGVQVRNQLYLRAAFGEFAPAAPGLPTEQADKLKPDALFRAAGIQNLSDEYKMILAATGGDRATATQLFIEQHPERFVYTVPQTQATLSKAYLPPTAESGKWLKDNYSFIEKYKSLAAYFAPQTDGPFDINAYHAQLETGVREHLTPSEFLDKYRNLSAASVYFAAVDARNKALEDALGPGGGGDAAQSRIWSNWDAWSTQFSAANPVWAEGEANLAQKQQTARETVHDLAGMLQDSHLPASVADVRAQLQEMLATYNVQQQWLGSQGANVSSAAKRAENDGYQAYMLKIAGDNPQLTTIFNAIFKPLTYSTN